MEAKIIKFNDLIFDFANKDRLNNPNVIPEFLKKMLSFSYDEGISFWEYLLIKDEQYLSDKAFNKALINDTLKIFYDKSITKTTKLLAENIVLTKAVYFYNFAPTDELAVDIAINYLNPSKLELAESIFKCLHKNPNSEHSYGTNMKTIVEKYFESRISKNADGSKKADIPKKTANFLITFIQKISGPGKPLLLQRIKEVL